MVHPTLTADEATLEALKELGLKPASPESRFRQLANELMRGEPTERLLEGFWAAARRVESTTASRIVARARRDWWKALRVRTLSRNWKPIRSVLLPGSIVPNDYTRDDSVALDAAFHKLDLTLLGRLDPLGLTDTPEPVYDLSRESWFEDFLSSHRNAFCARPLSKNPQRNSLNFEETVGVGPLEVMETLSDEGRALYTDALLALTETYEPWTMRHDTQHIYPPLECPSPAIEWLKKYGRIHTPDGVVAFRSSLGKSPNNLVALRTLLDHTMAEKIKQAFDLAELTPEIIGEIEVFGEADPIPLLDMWPGLKPYLQEAKWTARLIRCDRIIAGNMEWECSLRGLDIYTIGTLDEDQELRHVADKFGLGLDEERLALILRRVTPHEIEERRRIVREAETDEERLLEAVGKNELQSQLPNSLLTILRQQDGPLTGIRVAQAAIATWHTDTLRQYKEHLGHLDPPKNWAGSSRATNFVRALGFPIEWAGERGRRRDPFIEVDGPFTLPELHDYQNRVVGNIRELFRYGQVTGTERRGMVSMPTGSGKTRVAVQAIVEALREGEIKGGVLWVADRDELCEQAVEAWNQVWASKGARRQQLRISRLWQGQPDPLPTGEFHVVVASVQTLTARFQKKPDNYAFLADFSLVVFDEAHRSIAPTYTGVMQELGMTGRRRQPDEPFLLGLTATPYRGHNERETDWLARRYGSVRLDVGAFSSDNAHEVVTELQDLDVLAQADQKVIDGGDLDLSDDELQQMTDAPWLPRSAEERIAQDTERTMRIVEAFDMHVEPNWPTLIFATSVEHAQTLAALLTGRGIAARAVSGATETSARRRIVEAFRSGEIQALVNYGVFREGFDAPRTRAIIVARPVYSPNLYFQMIGRGLRGRLNGGNDRCLILNVHDNIQNYNRQLAFSDLDWLWDRRHAHAA